MCTHMRMGQLLMKVLSCQSTMVCCIVVLCGIAGHTVDSDGSCVCPPGGGLEDGCAAPMDPIEPSSTLYSKYGRGREYDIDRQEWGASPSA